MIFRGNKRLIRSDRAPGGNSGLHPSAVKMLEGKREQFQLEFLPSLVGSKDSGMVNSASRLRIIKVVI